MICEDIETEISVNRLTPPVDLQENNRRRLQKFFKNIMNVTFGEILSLNE